MRTRVRYAGLVVFSVLLGLCLLGCAREEKQASLEIVDSDFSIRKDSDLSYVIDASGTIANTGDVDVKNVKVTGRCESCGNQIINATWFVSDVDKMPNQIDVINYLAAGAQEEFEFEEVAFFSAQTGSEVPEGLPDGLKVVIQSHEIVE